MALLLDLYELRTNSVLRNRVTQGGLVVAEEVITEDPATTNHVNRASWAVQVMSNPDVWGERLLRYLVAQNWEMTVAQITGAADSAILTAIRISVNTFADNLGG